MHGFQDSVHFCEGKPALIDFVTSALWSRGAASISNAALTLPGQQIDG